MFFIENIPEQNPSQQNLLRFAQLIMELEELKDQMRSIGVSEFFFVRISWWFTCWILLVCAVMIDLS